MTPEVLEAIATASAIIIGPSNPVISIGPILALNSVKDTIRDAAAPVVAVSPLVEGNVFKGAKPGDCMSGPGSRCPATESSPATADCSTGWSPISPRRGLPVLETDVLMDGAEGGRCARRADARIHARTEITDVRSMAEPNPLAILPIKSFEEAKQRLGEASDQNHRREVAEAMFADVLIALRCCTLVDVVLVVAGDHGAQRIAAGYGAIVLEDEQQGRDEAARHGVDRALELGAERVLLVPGDCPLLDAAELDELIDSHPPGRWAVIVPDRHGSGTNALLLAPPDAMAPSFGPGGRWRERGRQAAGAGGRAECADGRGRLARARRRHAGGPGGSRGDAR